jgi:hypothetical protein
MALRNWRIINVRQTDSRASSPGEFHPEALVEPYVSLSTHTAPIAEP